jgi:hypothetical protein
MGMHDPAMINRLIRGGQAGTVRVSRPSAENTERPGNKISEDLLKHLLEVNPKLS